MLMIEKQAIEHTLRKRLEFIEAAAGKAENHSETTARTLWARASELWNTAKALDLRPAVCAEFERRAKALWPEGD